MCRVESSFPPLRRTAILARRLPCCRHYPNWCSPLLFHYPHQHPESPSSSSSGSSSSLSSGSFFLAAPPTLGTIFGGIHCAGWNLPFHTSAEERFWRVASLAVTINPIGAVPFSFIILTSTLALFLWFLVVIFRLFFFFGRPSYPIHLSDFKFYFESLTPSSAVGSIMPLL